MTASYELINRGEEFNINRPGVLLPGVRCPGDTPLGVRAPGVLAAGVLAPGVRPPGVLPPGVWWPGVCRYAFGVTPGVRIGVLWFGVLPNPL